MLNIYQDKINMKSSPVIATPTSIDGASSRKPVPQGPPQPRYRASASRQATSPVHPLDSPRHQMACKSHAHEDIYYLGKV